MKKIDIHTHVTMFPDIVPVRKQDNHRFLSLEEQLRVFDDVDITYGVLLPLISPECMWANISNQEAKTIADSMPEKFAWFCNVDPRAGSYSPDADLEHIVGFYKSIGAKGLGELTTPLYADDPMMDNLFSVCERLDMPVLIHIAPKQGDYYGIIDDISLPRLEKMLKKHPDLKLIGHSAPFWSEISGDITEDKRNLSQTGAVTEGRLTQLMREYGNLYCDLSAGSGSSAMMRDRDHAARFIEEFSDRIFYGTDVCSTKQTFHITFDEFLKKMLSDKLISEANYAKIMYGNAAKLLKLEL